MRTVAGSSGSDAGRCGTVRGPAGCCTVRPRDGHGRRARRGGSAGAAVQRGRAAADVCRSRRRTSRRFFARQAEDLRAEFSHARSSPALGASALTAAELRLLPLLSTPPVVPGDRRGGLPVPQHHQVDGALDLPQAGNLLTQPGRLPAARPRPPRSVKGPPICCAANSRLPPRSCSPTPCPAGWNPGPEQSSSCAQWLSQRPGAENDA